MKMLAKKTFSSILVPLDGSKSSLRGLKFAAVMAKQLGTSITCLNVYSLPEFVKISPIIKRQINQKSKDILRQADTILEEIPFSGISISNQNIGRTIVEFAKECKANMIIMGSKGPDPELGLFLGSVASYVVNKSKIPVTIVK